MRIPRRLLRKTARAVTKVAHYSRKHWLLICIWAAGVFFLLGGVFLLWASTLKIPDLSSLQSRKIDQSLKIYDRTGQVLLYDLNQNADRTVVPIAQISTNIQEATVAVEDPTFYQNSGINWKGILRALVVDVTSFGAVQGGSTITQQVVKQTILSGDKTITRKLKEVVLALKLDRVLSKDQILELYLNQAPYGGAIYGVEEASEQFFGVHASQVTLAEAAYLTAMLPAPTYYSPYGNNKGALDARKNLVLEKMYEQNDITAQERDTAETQTVVFLPQRATAIQAPHFVFYVEQYLEEKYGADALEQNGWVVTTTLDADLQEHAETIVEQGALSNAAKFDASNAALIAVDPANGQILAMVGSRNYFDTQIDGNFNVTLAARQPGSAFKPFAYSVAFEKGYTPDTVLFDTPTQFSTTCSPNDLTDASSSASGQTGCYAPQNYDNKFRGAMTLRDALAQSINVPSVEVLYLAGIADTLKLASAMGITTLGSADQYGLTLVLGGGEVTLLEMTSAYGTFAQNGVHYPTTAILKIQDGSGNVIEDDSQQAGTQVMPAAVAKQINDILSDPIARAPLGENGYLEFPGHDVAVKTGTTNNYRDAWTIGYTPNIAVGIWAGNNNNSPMTHNVSGFIVGPMWNQVMQYALSREASTTSNTFVRSDISTEAGLKPVLRGIWQGGDSIVIDSRTGQAAATGTPAQYMEEAVTCDVHTILYWLDKNNPSGPAPRNASSDPQYPYWEAAIQRWVAKNGSACVPGSQIVVGPYVPPAVPPLPASTTTETTLPN